MTILLAADVLTVPPVPPSSMLPACSEQPVRSRWFVELADTNGLMPDHYIVLASSEAAAVKIVRDRIFPFDDRLVLGARLTDVG